MKFGNLKENWVLVISAGMYYALNAVFSYGYFIGLPISLFATLILTMKIPSIWSYAKSKSVYVKIISALSATGVCRYCQISFYDRCSRQIIIQNIQNKIPFQIDLLLILCIISAILAFLFVYICILCFMQNLTKIFLEVFLQEKIEKKEILVYCFLIAASMIYVILVFINTDSFYGTDLNYDVVYTSDSPYLVKGNCYLSLLHLENDLRQPLFAVFAAPFVAIPYLIGQLLSVSPSVNAILLNCMQVVMIFAANFILTRIMHLSTIKRVCFMLISSFTYTQLLFIIMMEQYIVAYFWLILCCYFICENHKNNRLVLWGAGGTLLTSLVLLPFVSEKSRTHSFKNWCCDMIKHGMEFVALMLIFCRFDVMYDFFSKIIQLSKLTGRSISAVDKVLQYISFISSYFFAPQSHIDNTTFEHVSWQLYPITDINWIGVIIFVLCVLSIFVNREKKSSILAAGWILFSILMLLILGWGTAENGLILYSLYFGWAFLCLLFQLLEKIEERIRVHALIPIVSIVALGVMLAVNIPAIMKLIRFGMEYYPL